MQPTRKVSTSVSHYRNVDVSTVKELVKRWDSNDPHLSEKKNAHLAIEDIRESIEELKFFRRHFFTASR